MGIFGSRKAKNYLDERVDLPSHLKADVVVDVGVAAGTPWLYKSFPDARLLLVEPLNVSPGLVALLKGRDYKLLECAAGAEETVVEINYNVEKPSRSSFLERTSLTATSHSYEKRNVPVRRLDSIMAAEGYGSGTIGLKIDTEGYEIEVLKGADGILDRCSFVICEASIAKRFVGSYDFSELTAYMLAKGFHITSVIQFGRDAKGTIRFADILFEPKKA